MNLPSKWQLAQHWLASFERHIYAPRFHDLESPCCSACGWFSEAWEKTSPRASWERAKLERAHIVPRSHGGPGTPENIILLCAPCHLAAPDWHEPSEMALWIAERPERPSAGIEEMSEWWEAICGVPEFGELLKAAEGAPGMSSDDAVDRIIAALWGSTLKSSVHAGMLSPGTKVAIVRDVAKQGAGLFARIQPTEESR